MLVLFFAVDQHVFGAEGPQAPGIVGVVTDVRDLTLPVLTLTLVTIAIFARYMRSSALDSLAQEYVEAARARGAGQRRVLTAHVLRNSLVPVVTLVGLSFPQIVGGAVVVESLFNIQGMGWQIWQAVLEPRLPGDARLHAGDRRRRRGRVAAGRHRVRGAGSAGQVRAGMTTNQAAGEGAPARGSRGRHAGPASAGLQSGAQRAELAGRARRCLAIVPGEPARHGRRR